MKETDELRQGSGKFKSNIICCVISAIDLHIQPLLLIFTYMSRPESGSAHR
jgi:hypothetical protein